MDLGEGQDMTIAQTQVEGLKLAALAFEKDVTKLSCCAG